ncbi:uncharacterized protein LOC121427921 [Lytechinus variegatus]|uniref:uncharacterized protein LOC121427921 n=1 Tax=Lytechinus variegatus TaxID=7654 RepID=UPI001BB12127|nr:uncharacterized protein LOC121427921 [Lytechinus variegatus]
MDIHVDIDSMSVENMRRSARIKKLTEKAIMQKKDDELQGKFYSEHLDLLTTLKDTDRLLSSFPIDENELSLRKSDISARFDSLRKVASELEEIQGGVNEDIAKHLDELSPIIVDTISKIVVAVSESRRETFIEAPSVSKKSAASKMSKMSTISSKRAVVAAEAAALQEKLAAHKRQNECQMVLERLEMEEDARRKEASLKIEQLRRKLEEERLEGELKAQEAMIRVYDEVEDDGASTDTMRSTKQLIKSPNQDDKRVKSQKHDASIDPPVKKSKALNPDSPVFQPSHSSSEAQQNESLAEVLTRTMTLSRLPIPEPPVFMGDPLQYPDWLSAFTTLIECRGIPSGERIHYLRKYIGGSAREAVSGFFLLRSEKAYEQAREILEKRFGNPFTISEAFRSKLDSWPRIGNRDSKGLQKLSDFLQQCLQASSEIKDLEILNDIREMSKICMKLPDWIVHRWNRTVAKVKKDNGRYPSFREFVSFLSEETDIANDPYVTYDTVKAGKDKNHNDAFQIQEESKNPTSRQQRTTFSVASKTSTTQKTCVLCKRQNHGLNECWDFNQKTLEQRRDLVKKEGLCFGCLSKGHMSKQCQKRAECKKCNKRHPTSLHNETLNQLSTERKHDQSEAQSTQTKEVTKEKEASCNRVRSDVDVSLTSMVLPVYLSSLDDPQKEILVYALLDTMSDTTFITDSIGNDLQVSSETAMLSLTTMTDSKTIPCRKFKNLVVRGFKSAVKIPLPAAYSRDSIPLDEAHIPTEETANKWTHLNNISNQLAPKQDCPIGLLIGYNCARALAPKNCILGKNDEPFAVETELGWSIVGGSQNDSTESFDTIGQTYRTLNVKVADPSLTNSQSNVKYIYKTQLKEVTAGDFLQMMERDFHELDRKETMSQEDKKFLKIIKDGIHQRDDGYYEMPLPFKKGEPDLPDNRKAAMSRLHGLKNQFLKRPKYHEHYMTFMNEILKRGDAEKIPTDEVSTSSSWYIPHHGVYHPKKPNKVRVVFDCSARYQGTCLNDHLLQGPDLINPLIGVLCRFRQAPIAFTCDVEKMYHQFRVTKEHQDYLRFLWWEDGDLSKPPVDYRMKVHLFGATSSPGCANFGLKQIAEDHKVLGVEAAEFLKRNFYVDDGLKCVSSEEDAIDLIKKAVSMCAKGNLRLHKFVCNNQRVTSSIPESERTVVAKTSLELGQQGSTSIERALGIQWCINSDEFCFRLTLKDHPLTRRGILATVASIYDPLGLIAPVVLVGRQIVQEMCRQKMDWDHPVPEDLRPQWEKWRLEILKLPKVTIPRCFEPQDFGTPQEVQLHHFSDASLSGYGQCSYVRLKDENGKVHCSLAMAKARVTPLKPTTIPRLELQAATCSVRIASILNDELDYDSLTHHFWTDSKVVLGYIYNETRRFHMYVANRVERILQTSCPEQWNYVSSAENPADHASRGLTTEEMLSSNWLTGPTFLWKSEIPTQDVDVEVSPDDVEVKSAATVHVTQVENFTYFEDRLTRFSSLHNAVSAVAVIVKCCYRKKDLSIDEVEARRIAERNIIRAIQKEAFREERKQIKSDPSVGSKSNSLKQLDPFLDNDNLLRVGGRLKKAEMMYGAKHPIILPKRSHLSNLVALHYHQRTAHQGRNLTINAIRSSGYWIIGCRSIVSSLISKCVICIKSRGKPRGQKMADLPQDRVDPSPPFTYCGLDCFGPFTLKEGRKEIKRYGLILTCMAMRAVHIEMLDDLSTDAFLNGLRCFIAIRGNVRLIRCDQGSNFIGAKHELKKGLRELDGDRVATQLLKLDCEFKMNPPSSSHMGGIWERQIRNVRNVLDGILEQSGAQLNTSSLRTFLYEAMAIINSRPLTVEDLECADGPLPLTPNHVLTMKSGIVMPPPGKFEREDLYLSKRWRRVQYLTDLFWIRWKKEYLHTLQTRKTWPKQQRNFEVNDIVMLQDDGLCRTHWSIAKVVQTFVSDDGFVRRVKLLKATPDLDKNGKPLQKRTVLERPVHKLISLVPNSD